MNPGLSKIDPARPELHCALPNGDLRRAGQQLDATAGYTAHRAPLDEARLAIRDRQTTSIASDSDSTGFSLQAPLAASYVSRVPLDLDLPCALDLHRPLGFYGGLTAGLGMER